MFPSLLENCHLLPWDVTQPHFLFPRSEIPIKYDSWKYSLFPHCLYMIFTSFFTIFFVFMPNLDLFISSISKITKCLIFLLLTPTIKCLIYVFQFTNLIVYCFINYFIKQNNINKIKYFYYFINFINYLLFYVIQVFIF